MLSQSWRPVFDLAEVHRELQIIRDDLCCNAVRIYGQDLDRPAAAGQPLGARGTNLAPLSFREVSSLPHLIRREGERGNDPHQRGGGP
jgi:hypothetical protein